jgi:hypothetical protein
MHRSSYPGAQVDAGLRSDADERLEFAKANPPGPRHARLKESSRPVPLHTALQDGLATAFDELAAWVNAAPAERSCWALNRKSGRWTCGLAAGEERFTAGQDATLGGAIRNALMIAKFAGCP